MSELFLDGKIITQNDGNYRITVVPYKGHRYRGLDGKIKLPSKNYQQ